MSRYQIWDKKTDIFTPSGHKFTAAEWLAKYPWADLPGVKMIITSGTINGGAAMEFQATVDRYTEMGADFSNCETDEDYLAAIEEFELHPPGYDQPTIEERTAAALEAQVLMAMPEAETATVSTMSVASARMASTASATAATAANTTAESAAFQRIQRNYQKGLWNAALVNMAASRGQITSDEASAILNG